MTKAPTTSPSTSSILRGQEVTSFLGAACRESWTVELRLGDSAESAVKCTMTSVKGDRLMVRLSANPDSPNPIRKGCAVRGRLLHRDKVFVFDTFCIGIGGDASPAELVLHRPTTIEQRERRRSARRSFRESSLVRVSFALADARHDVQGELLNVSEGGMACRFTATDITRLNRHALVGLTFRLTDDSEKLKLKGQVVSITPASEGRAIVGFEFSHDYATNAEFNLFRTQLQSLQQPKPETLS